MLLRVVISFFLVTTFTAPVSAEEETLNWNFETESGAAYELAIKGSWEAPGMAFWRGPSEVSVKGRLEVIQPPEKGTLVYGFCAYFYDEDDFQIFEKDFFIGQNFLKEGAVFNSSWTMPHDQFVEIHRAAIYFDRTPPSIYRIRDCS